MPIQCIRGMEGWGEIQGSQDRRDEARVEDCNRCPKYDNCSFFRDEEYYEMHCMNRGKGCLYKPTVEERRMDI